MDKLNLIFKFIKSFLLILLISFSLSLILDFLFGKKILKILDGYLVKTSFYERLIRVDHKYYHHTLKPNVKYKKAKSFENYFTLCTDNHGFKYQCDKKRNKKFDIAFIGDSFTEGVGLNYENTFVGIFENEKNMSIANLGVTSYAPNIYLSKVKYLLDQNYEFDHLFIFIDISDLYDDNVFYKLNPDYSVGEKNAKKKNLKIIKFLRYNFPITNYYMYVIKMNQRINSEVPPVKSETPIFNKKASIKASWTYQENEKIDGYNEDITKTKNHMIQTMTLLYNILKERNIEMSIGVYPWPQQLKNDKVNSEHVNMWKKFCISKCKYFVNFFPIFFEKMNNSSYINVYKKYFFWNDVHFNKEGNKLIANKLLEVF